MPVEWREVVAPADTRVVAPDGTWVVYLKAGEVTRVHPSVFGPALVAGCSVPGGSAGQQQTDDEIVEALADAMLEIINAGDKSQLTENGEPRHAALKSRVASFSGEHRAAAWALVQAVIDPPADGDESPQ